MLRIKREEIAPRMEMTAMIDVIFLLLTFFIYSLAMMISARVLPVQLTTVSAAATGSGTSQTTQVQAITIDKAGVLYFNREPVSMSQLDSQLRKIAGDADQPTVYLAMEAQGTTDRGPLLMQLIDRVRGAGIDRFVIVGQKPVGSPTGETP